MSELKAPFPYFGGKSRAAHLIWERLGDVSNYVEPFAGSLAVLLSRPHEPKTETINDADGLLCVAPETRILRDDLRWYSAADVAVGDKVIAFDEENGPPQSGTIRRQDRPDFQPPQSMRKWRVATVTNVKRVTRPAYRLTFDDGTTVTASADHLWLAGKSKAGGRGARWISTKGLRCDASEYASHVIKLCDVVEQADNAEAGWMGGFYDGEGNIQGAGAGWRLSVAQKLGPEADRAEAWLRDNGFAVFRAVRQRPNPKHLPVASLTLNGGMRETLRFLMVARPERLIRTAISRLNTRSIYARERQVVRLVDKEFLGETEVVAIETDCHTYIAEGLASHNCNFWRALRFDPEAVAYHADWPVNENDLHARHSWLVNRREDITRKLEGDPDWFDAKAAGWWVWGISLWIGSGWCSGRGAWVVQDGELVNLRQLPHLGDAGQGVNRQLPHLGNAGQGVNRKRQEIQAYFERLSDRLRGVRVCCGDWSRVTGPSVTFKHGVTGVFLDPPYADTAERAEQLYAKDCLRVAHEVREWAIANGNNPQLRICVAGYEGEHQFPDSWERVAWHPRGGYDGQNRDGDNENRKRERLWFSPHCLRVELPLFKGWNLEAA